MRTNKTKRLDKLEQDIKRLQDQVAKLKMKDLPVCPRCKSKRITKRGMRYTLNEAVQKYYCKDCDWKFSRQGITFRMRNSEKDIRKALWLRKKGYTTSQIAEIIGGVSRQTIFRWIQEKDKSPKNKLKIAERKMKSRWGTEYKRKFEIRV